MNPEAVLNLVLYLPLAGAVLLAMLPRDQHAWHRYTALGIAIATMLVSWTLLFEFRTTSDQVYQFVLEADWIPQFGIKYKTGVDGISFTLILLTTLLSTIAVLSSFDAIQSRVREYYLCLLLLETGMLGVFMSLDMILFYVFWEAMLIPMYFLIGIWGGARRRYATIKFVLYTLVGSLLMLVAIVWVYYASAQAGTGTFDITLLTDPLGPLQATTALTPDVRFWLFLAFTAAFAIKVPMFPVHTWLPDAHVEAPTAGSVILAGVLLKMGTYGFVRFCIPLFPDVAIDLAPWFLALSAIGIIYGALMAYVQVDVKRLVAYSSVSHLGFCVLGLFAFTVEGVGGSVLQMINHGLSTGALFLLVGMLYERRHTRDIAAFGGIWKVMPVFTAFFLITTLSSIGLPGLNGFVGEFLVLLGTWGAPVRGAQLFTILSATGVILGAIYMLWMFQRVFQGPITHAENRKLSDVNWREIAAVLPLILLMFWIGVRPTTVTRMFDQAVYTQVVQPVDRARMLQNMPEAAPFGGQGLPPGFGAPPGGLPPGFGAPPGGGGLPPGLMPPPAPGGAPEGGSAPPPAPGGAGTAPAGGAGSEGSR
ncbi:MAG: NADH-quinone oxidoreductase subunit M [Armatimonadota bacterium]